MRKFAHYGALSGKALDDLRAGARVEVDEDKDDPLDFVLWKAAKPGEPHWDSPWGSGRPGWHIECSAMSMHCLGNHFDIHGGGMDLKFPHHENEIAQSEGATGEQFVNVWMHNGFVRVDDEKMSKSLGNFFTVREVLEGVRAGGAALFSSSRATTAARWIIRMRTLKAAKSALDGFYIALRGIAPAAAADDSEYAGRFQAAMDDDFNTPVAFAVLFGGARDINQAPAPPRRPLGRGARRRWDCRALAGIPGSARPRVGRGTCGVPARAIWARPRSRRLSRSASRPAGTSNWAESDRLRDELKTRASCSKMRRAGRPSGGGNNAPGYQALLTLCSLISNFSYRGKPYQPRPALPGLGRVGFWDGVYAAEAHGCAKRVFSFEVTVELTGADIFVRCLADEGVEYVFGYPGGAALHIYDALYKQDKVKHILVRHEQGAAHAADGYARATGRPGVVLVTSGPGVTNTVTGIATAYMDSIPAGGLQRPGADQPDRPRRLPGSGRRRHHAPVREAQLPGEGRQGPRDHHQEGVLHRHHRPPRPGAGGHPQGRHRAQVRVRLSRRTSPCARTTR